MTEFDWKEETLCSNNLQVKFYLQTIKKSLKKVGFEGDEIYQTINQALEVLRVMKKQGQKIEDRARKYRQSIEGLGFKRIEKKSLTKMLKNVKIDLEKEVLNGKDGF